MADRSPDRWAEEMVRVVSAVAGGSSCVEVRAPGRPPIRLRGHQNPALVLEEATQVRAFVAAVIQEAWAVHPEKVTG
jgi:hypothetical protein